MSTPTALTSPIERINAAFTRLELGIGEAHAKAVREHPEFIVIDMRHGYHVCAHPEEVARMVEALTPSPSHRALCDQISRNLDPFLVPYTVRDRVRWTGSGGREPHCYTYRTD